VITKDNSPTNVDAIVYVRVIDPEKAWEDLARYATYEPADDLPYKVENQTIMIGKKEPGKWWI